MAKFDTTQIGAAQLKYATYLGGSATDYGAAIALNPLCPSNCNAYIAGGTSQSDFPATTGQTTFGGTSDAIVAEFDASGNVVYARYLGGLALEGATGIVVDAGGAAYVIGNVPFSDFPTVNPIENYQAPNGALFESTDSESSFFQVSGWPANLAGSPSFSAIGIGNRTDLNNPQLITLDVHNNVYVAQNPLAVYAAGSSGDVAPVQAIHGSNGALGNALGIAVDPVDGNILTTSQSNNEVLIFSAGATGNSTPLATISGNNTGLNAPAGIALDSNRNVYVANSARWKCSQCDRLCSRHYGKHHTHTYHKRQ